ncbi:4Fe-4S cluster-binding domain-containing protein [Microbacterium sp. CH-015]|uniref:4Fe-4S cluster-binding domain-containing protein n=1 Tax=Microbacterium sp. CH-015 TaxID=3406734 RepID=UPI003C7182C3
MKIQVNRIAHPVTVLGPGRRIGVWVQGCHIGCPGCASVDTWDAETGETLDTAALASELATIIKADDLTGVTLTGGEPTEQAAELTDLVIRLRDEVKDRQLDVLMFTGRTAKAAERTAPNLWAVVDAAICGPYRESRPGTDALIASANQTLVVRTELGAERMGELERTTPTMLQARVGEGEITLIGLPGPGDLPRIEAALRQRGVVMEGRSWLTP